MKQKLIETALALILGGMVLGLLGCGKPLKKETALDLTPKQVLVRTVEKTDWLTTFAVLGLGLSVFSIMNGNTKFGIGGLAAFWVILVISLSVSRYYEQLALWGAIAGTVGIGGMLLYSILIKNKALKEIVGNVQNYKEDKISTIRDYLRNQSNTTKEIVSQVKGELRAEK